MFLFFCLCFGLVLGCRGSVLFGLWFFVVWACLGSPLLRLALFLFGFWACLGSPLLRLALFVFVFGACLGLPRLRFALFVVFLFPFFGPCGPCLPLGPYDRWKVQGAPSHSIMRALPKGTCPLLVKCPCSGSGPWAVKKEVAGRTPQKTREIALSLVKLSPPPVPRIQGPENCVLLCLMCFCFPASHSG